MRKFLRISVVFGLGCYILTLVAFILGFIFMDSIYPYEVIGNIALGIGVGTLFIDVILIGIEKIRLWMKKH